MAFLEQRFIPSLPLFDSRKPSKIFFNFAPHKPGDNYRGLVFPVDYGHTERYKALTMIGYTPVVKSSHANQVVIDFEPPQQQPLEVIVNTTPVIENGLSPDDILDYTEQSRTLGTIVKEDLSPILTLLGYLSSGVRKGVALIPKPYLLKAIHSSLERRKQKLKKGLFRSTRL